MERSFEIAFFSAIGLALLLGGMKLMEAALSRWAGHRLARWLGRATSSPVRGFLSGAAASALLQSSTAVTLLTVGFVNAGWMTLGRSFAVLLGTNVGTCLTTELISLHVHRYGLPLAGISLAGWLFTAFAHEMRGCGRVAPGSGLTSLRYGSVAAFGLSVLFIGFGVLQQLGPYLRENGAFGELLGLAERNVIWAVLGGAALAALVHSSAAVIGMAMGLAAAGAISLEAGVAVVLGANFGTCFTGLIASLGGGRGGRFVALSQLALNGAGATLFIPLIPLLLLTSAWLSPGDVSAQIAHAQTLFNVASALLAFPLAYMLRK